MSYLAADGRIHLWYPGNQRVLQGDWSVIGQGALIPLAKPGLQALIRHGPTHLRGLAPADPSEDVAYVCFRYAANTFNPDTDGHAGGWECTHASEYVRAGTTEAAAGDLFGLAGRQRVPRETARASGENEDFEALQRSITAREKSRP